MIEQVSTILVWYNDKEDPDEMYFNCTRIREDYKDLTFYQWNHKETIDKNWIFKYQIIEEEI